METLRAPSCTLDPLSARDGRARFADRSSVRLGALIEQALEEGRSHGYETSEDGELDVGDFVYTPLPRRWARRGA